MAAIRQLGADHNVTVDATEDAAAFTDANLARYDVVVKPDERSWSAHY
jgi:cytochrome c